MSLFTYVENQYGEPGVFALWIAMANIIIATVAIYQAWTIRNNYKKDRLAALGNQIPVLKINNLMHNMYPRDASSQNGVKKIPNRLILRVQIENSSAYYESHSLSRIKRISNDSKRLEILKAQHKRESISFLEQGSSVEFTSDASGQWSGIDLEGLVDQTLYFTLSLRTTTGIGVRVKYKIHTFLTETDKLNHRIVPYASQLID